MNNWLKIISLKGLVSIQDLGRLASQHLGFTAGGAADEYAFRFANSLLNNDQNSATLEVTLGQIELQATCDCFIAIAGAECQATISQQTTPPKPINNWHCHLLKKDEIITLHYPKDMLHSYIAVKGGLQSTLWLNSRSQSWVENELGFTGNILRAGDQVALDGQENASWSSTPAIKPSTSQGDFYENGLLHLRFIPSSLFLSLTSYQQKQFIEQSFTIEAKSNRMGYRLRGNIVLQQFSNTLSKPVSYGSIQLPNQGQPIILMKEKQTIGGYPIFGSVIQTDLFRLSQKRPGEKIRFITIKLAQAQAQLAAFFQRFN